MFEEILVFSHFVRKKYSLGLTLNPLKSFQLIFLTLVSIGRVFNFLSMSGFVKSINGFMKKIQKKSMFKLYPHIQNSANFA